MSTADGAVVGTTKIVDHGLPSRRFNIVLVAEGYRQAELGKFAADAQQYVNTLFATPPFDELRCAFNVYRIDVSSTDSGADDPAACGGSGAVVATYFDASFCNGGIRRLLVVNGTTALNVVNAQVPQWHVILVIVNSPIWGGSGGSVATTSTAFGWENIAIHEMGHTVFGFADEYEYYAGCGIDVGHDQYPGGEPAQPNVTTNMNRATMKWGGLVLAATALPTTGNANCTQCDPQPNPLPAGTVGAFEGAYYYHCSVYRPGFDCMMRNLSPFCGRCRQVIRQTMQPYLADCYAPTFAASGGFGCLIVILFSAVVLALLLVLAVVYALLCALSGRESNWCQRLRDVSCLIKRIQFRISRCSSGNADPCIEL